ncbi:MAG: HlyD family efflux transporter periplasmic adaptor subunit [Gemmatales bacterium]|nr:HlyD family efflux transporter periplasmic adaptor subunit [Gemmatales bacterium]MCS7159802.1 HlyD family efflux transporter periplasmic adaptor subunit [Gemmatales bacterium]MDW8175000.1 HlyD family efflux transporter periplasmic adaptor subunit [Gemmatales bacterium]MDW8223478.1 HlyD family efflux transporter periplasmic adaptor subunit [Gemmatales bacterium]
MKKLLASLLLLAALLTGAAYWWSHSPSNSVVPPRTEVIDRGPIVLRVASGQGKFVPQRLIPIVTDVAAGKIVAVNPKAEPGQFLEAGEWLVRLDSTQAELTLKRTEAELAAAIFDLEQARYRLNEVETKKHEADASVRYAEKYLEAVRSNGNTDLERKAQAQLELARQGQKAAEVGLKAAQAAVNAAAKKVEAYQVGVEAARKQLALCTIHAPEAGFVLEKRIVPGQLITPQAVPILFLMTPQLDELEIAVQVNESDILKITPGMEVEFSVEALSGENVVFQGRVQRISLTPTASGLSSLRVPMGLPELGNIWSLLSGPSSGAVNYQVTVSAFQPPPPRAGQVRAFKPGMTANVDFIRRLVAESVLRIPNEALTFRPPSLRSDWADQIRAQETSSRKPVWIWLPNGRGGRIEMTWVTIRPDANDGKYTQLEDPGDLKEGTQVVVEIPTPAPKGGLFETPIRIGPN